MTLWSIHTFWYKGSAENKEKMTWSKKGQYLLKIAAQTQRLICGKSQSLVFGCKD